MLFLLAMSALDTAVLRKTRDLGLAWTDGHAQGQPFPEGLTWSVRRFDHIVERRTAQLPSWCEDATQSHTLRVFVGSFHARLGSGYSIGLEPVDGGNVQSSPQATLRVHVAPLSRWFDGTPVLLLCDTLEIFGVVSIVLGCAQLFAERS
jgi:hypothetical protein